MNRDDNSKYLLYIEPQKIYKYIIPINDDVTSLVEIALSKSVKGNGDYSNLNDMGTFSEHGGWMGSHETDCGEMSDSFDYKLENGMITNSLATFYVRYYRDQIPNSDIEKLKELKEFYKLKGDPK